MCVNLLFGIVRARSWSQPSGRCRPSIPRRPGWKETLMEMQALRAELERLFELDELLSLSKQLLGVDPDAIGGEKAKGSFVRALTDHCLAEHAIEALCDAVVARKPHASTEFRQTALVGLRGPALSVGQDFGDMTITRKLGAGPTGTCFEATSGDVSWRLKVLHTACCHDIRGLQRFATHCRVLANTEGSGADGLEVGLIDGQRFVRQPFERGTTLAERSAQRGPIHISEAGPWFRGVLKGLQELHERQLVHGNLKLENVLLATDDDRERVVLLDAGADRLRGQVDENGCAAPLAISSAKTTAPELLRGQPVSARSDVYAAGALLYELLTQQPPFHGESTIEQASAHLECAASTPSDVAPRGSVSFELDAFILRLLSKSPDERPADAQSALAAFDSLMLGQSSDESITEEELQARMRALSENPTDDELALSLEAAADEGGDPTRIAEAFLGASRQLRQAGDSSDSTWFDLGFRAGRLFRRAGDMDRAESTYAELLEHAPHNPAARAALEDLRRRLGKHEELIDMWLGQADLAPTPIERASFMAKIGSLYDQALGDSEQAVVAYTQAYCDHPLESDYVHAIERLAGRNVNVWTEVLTSCAEAASAAEAQDEQGPMLVQIGQWYTDRLGRLDLALECFKAVLDNDAANEGALEGLTKIYRKSQQWAELAELLLRRADAAATPEAARRLRAQAAETLDRRLGDLTRAQQIYESIIEEDPAHQEANDALASVFQRAGDTSGYVNVLRRQADNLRGGERLSMICRIGEAYEDQSASSVDALDTYKAVLGEDPHNLSALRGLDRVYSKTGDYEQLLETLQAQTRVAATPRQKAMLYERLAGLYEEEFLDRDKALENYQAVLALDSRHDGALTGLQRIYRAQQRWDELLDLYGRHAEFTDDPKRKAQLLYQRGKLFADELKSPHQAIVALEAVLSIDSEHAEALAALADLKQQSGDADEALAALDALAQNASSETTKAENYVRAARLLEKRNDLAGASERYKLALDAVPTHTDAATGLRLAYVKLGDVAAAVEMLHHQISLTDSATTAGKLAAELARLTYEQGDVEQARLAAAQALEWNDTSVDAQEVLARIAMKSGDFAQASQYLGRLIPHLDSLPRDRAVDVLVSYVETLSRQGSVEAALGPVSRLHELAPDNPTAHLRIAKALFEHGSAETARSLFADILERFDDRLSATERATVTYYHGEATRLVGQTEVAISILEEASDLDPRAQEPLVALAKAFATSGDWEESWEAQSRLLDLLEGDAKVQLLIDMGELAMDKLDDRQRATRCLVAAVDVRPDDRRLLTRLMQLYSEDKDWAKAVDVVLRLARFVDEPTQKARYLMTAGMVRSREMADYDGALECFSEVMTLDPSLNKPFDESISIHRDRGDFEAAEALLKDKMTRASAARDTAKLLETFTALGELYRDDMNRDDDAIEAFEAAQTIDPDNRQRMDMLAELYAANSSKHFDKARATYTEILEHDPYRADAYSALRKLYTEAKNPDGAWLLCQALYVLKLAAPDEERFFKRMRSEDPAYAQDVLTPEDWTLDLVHPEQDPLLTDIFAIIEPSVIATRGYEFADLGYDEHNQIDLEHHRYPIGQTLHYAAGVMDMAAPPTFENTNDPGGLVFLDTKVPAISMGVGVLNPHLPPQMLAFVAGSHLSYYRPGHFVRQLVGTGTGLKSWLFAAIKLISPTFPLAADLEGPVSEAVTTLQSSLGAQSKDELARAVSKLLQSAAALDLKKWVSAVDLTADRIGLLLAHDLEAAVEVIRGGEETAPGMSQRRLKEAVLFSISPNYLRLRERLGINLAI